MSELVSEGIKINGEMPPLYREILTNEALQFITRLARAFTPMRNRLLLNREERQKRLDQGELPDFLPETAEIREGNWTIAPLPEDLQDRRVEITGPAGDRKMVINAMNSGAKVFMADFEDANSPTWKNTIGGQIHLRDAVNGTIDYRNPNGKEYRLNDNPAVLIVRPRGWHLDEKHILVDGNPVPGGLVDFGLYFFHNARKLLEKGSGPYFYLPKVESHLEARLWNDVFLFAEHEFSLPKGTIKATVLIETIMAAFEMDEILYELREHSAGLNCGRWDYIFSYIKRLRNHSGVILPDRERVTMTVPFMRAYTLLAIKTCHRRNAPCIGGMAAQIPIKNDQRKNAEAIKKVRLDKEREAKDGHDGTWVAHPGLVPVAMEMFDKYMTTPNQIDNKREDVHVEAKDLLAVPKGMITEYGLRKNIRVAIQYLESWLQGMGAAAIDHLMEDAATAEISRTQVWQWIRHEQGNLSDGRKITKQLVSEMIDQEVTKLRRLVGEEAWKDRDFEKAKQIFSDLVLDDEYVEFLTLPASEYLN